MAASTSGGWFAGLDARTCRSGYNFLPDGSYRLPSLASYVYSTRDSALIALSKCSCDRLIIALPTNMTYRQQVYGGSIPSLSSVPSSHPSLSSQIMGVFKEVIEPGGECPHNNQFLLPC